MTGWLLILTLSIPGQPDSTAAIGILFGPALCEAAGASVAAALEAESPGLRARWTCREMPKGEAA